MKRIFFAELITWAIGLFLAGIVLFGLAGTPYSLNGDNGDQGLLIAQVTKFSYYRDNVDFAYKGLPAFYPPLYAFALSLGANILNLAPYKLVKYGLIAVVLLLPFLIRRSWKPLLDERALMFIPFVVLLYQDWYKPAEWLSLALFIPWWFSYMNTEAPTEKRKQAIWLITGGLIGAIIFQLYYYWFFVGALSLLTMQLLRASRFFPSEKQEHASLTNRGPVLAGVALFSVLYWAPLLISFIRVGEIESLQNRFFSAELGQLGFPFFEISVRGVFLLIGLVYLIATARRIRLSFLLLNLLVAAYLFQLIGNLTVLINLPVLSFKAREVVDFTLAFAAILGLTHFVALRLGSTAVTKPTRIVVNALVVIVLIYFGWQTLAGFMRHELREQAYESSFPQRLVASYQTLTRGEDADKTFLIGIGNELQMYTPAFEFLSWSAHFSHPAALFHRRADFLNDLSQIKDPACFAASILNNRYTAIDHALLAFDETSYIYTYFDDNFPNGTIQRTVFFPKPLFDNEYFESLKGDDWFFFTPLRENDPLVGAGAGFASQEALVECLDTMGRHLSFDGQAELEAELAGQVQ